MNVEGVDHEERTMELLEELEEYHSEDLLHLLDCAVCQGLARERIDDTAGAARVARPDYGVLLEGLEARTPGLLKEVEEQDSEARALLDKLLGSHTQQRASLAGTPEFRNLKLADLLLYESWTLLPGEPALAEERARLAFRVVAQPYPAGCASRINDVKARANVLTANARRLAGDRLGAEDYFRRAAAYLTCPPEWIERAFYCQSLAALRQEQGRIDETLGLLWRAALLYGENSDLLEQGACLAELGFLYVQEDQMHRATMPLSQACEVLSLHRDSTLLVRARLALAVCYARLGQRTKALRSLRAVRALYDRVADSPQEMAHVTWMEGKVAVLTGNLEDAPGLLDTARKSFVRSGRLYDAAFASLDLAAALAKAQRLETLGPLIHDIVEGFVSDVPQAGVLRVLGKVESALQRGRGGELGDVVDAATELLRGYRRNPLLVFEGLPSPSSM